MKRILYVLLLLFSISSFAEDTVKCSTTLKASKMEDFALSVLTVSGVEALYCKVNKVSGCFIMASEDSPLGASCYCNKSGVIATNGNPHEIGTISPPPPPKLKNDLKSTYCKITQRFGCYIPTDSPAASGSACWCVDPFGPRIGSVSEVPERRFRLGNFKH